MSELNLGSVVLSKMGRDKGSHYLITALTKDGFALIADGDKRKIEKPKKKKLIHLKPIGVVLDNLTEKLKGKKIIHNKELISALKAFNGGDQCQKTM